MHRWVRFLIRVVVLLVVLPAWAIIPPAQSTAESIVAQHNSQALQLYGQLKTKYIQQTDPLIIAWGDRLAFYHHHVVHEYPLISEEYVELKTIAHVTLAIFALFHPMNQFPNNRTDVKAYDHLVVHTATAVNDLALSLHQKERQHKILELTHTLLSTALDKNVMTQQAVTHFFRVISPFVMENIHEATKIQIDLINKQMMKIQHQLTQDERNKLFVIIPGPKMPRQENMVGQYFSKYLNVPMESERLIYAEGVSDSTSALSTVGAWQVESLLSGSYFHDPDRMKKDLLSSSARQYLQHCQVDRTGKMALICK